MRRVPSPSRRARPGEPRRGPARRSACRPASPRQAAGRPARLDPRACPRRHRARRSPRGPQRRAPRRRIGPQRPAQSASTAIRPGDAASDVSHAAGICDLFEPRDTNRSRSRFRSTRRDRRRRRSRPRPMPDDRPANGSRRSSCLKIRSRGPRISSSSNRLRISSRLDRPRRRSPVTHVRGTSRTTVSSAS